MTKFKKGDRVRCVHVHSKNNDLVVGKVYTFESEKPDSEWGSIITLKEMIDYGYGSLYYKFELIPTELETWHAEFPNLVSYIKEVMRHD